MQKIIVFQHHNSGENKIAGIEKYGNKWFEIKRISIDVDLPPVIDDSREYLPDSIQADLVLDFLQHPDLTHDLGAMCSKNNIPVIASGKKLRIPGVHTPPT